MLQFIGMKTYLRDNLTIVLAFALPVLLIVVVALSAYLPSLFLSTNYNFIYATCDGNINNYSYQCNNYLQKRYSVEEGKIMVNDVVLDMDTDGDGVPDTNEVYLARIFLHDTEKNLSREITLAEAKELTLDPLLTSPDEVSVSSDYSYSGDFLFFGGGSSYGYFLTKGKSKSKLNLIENGRYYRDDFEFIGWILPGRN